MHCSRFFLLALMLLTSPLSAEWLDTAWVRLYDGPYSGAADNDWGHSIIVDDSGFVYVGGTCRSTGMGNGYDIVTIKYRPNGDTAWVRLFNGPGNAADSLQGLAIDGSGNVYVTGWTYSATTDWDFVTIKYGPSGDTSWVRLYNGTGNGLDQANDIGIDNQGNCYVTGTSLGSSTSWDWVTVKYDSDGDTLWLRRYDSGLSNMEVAAKLRVDSDGNVLVAGDRYNSSTSNWGVLLRKYRPDGSTAWTRTPKPWGAVHDYYRDMCIDSSGYVYLLGLSDLDYSGTIRYDSLGTEIFSRRLLVGSSCNPVGIASDHSGGAYVLTGYSVTAHHLARYGPDGDTAWTRVYTTSPHSLAVSATGDAYVTGSSYGSDFDFSTSKYSAAGQRSWTETWNSGGTCGDVATAISIDSKVSFYLTGWGGNCDIVTIKYSRMSEDSDGDGVQDISDNCPLVPNTNQLDANSNGFGDVCECAPSYSVNAGLAGDGFGTSVSTAGDVNSDGSDDFVVGAPSNDELGVNAGRAYVLSGTTGSPLWVLGSSTGNPANEKFGSAVGGGVDINGDFVSDVAIGAPFNSTQASQAGAVSVFSGATGSLVNIEHGIPSASNWLGTSLAVLGLVDNDALGDFAAGAPLKADYGGDGTAYVFRGTTGAGGEILDTINGIISDYLGGSVAATGDIDNDGHADVIVGAYGTSGAVAGRAVVCSIYPTDSVIFQFTGETNGDQFGRSVGGGGDFNNDGTNDFIVGAPFNAGGGFQSGRAYIYSGASGALLQTLTGIAGENFGWATSFVGDINLDGFDDVAVSSPGRSTNDGLVQIFAGGSGLLLYAFPAPVSNALAGWSIAGQLDCDNDGGLDLIVGAPMTSPAVAGRAYVYLLGDTDNDGLIALKDNCPYAFNPSQVDSDNDSIGDACDECVAIAAEPWQFGNSVSNMWPPSWWQQFNYCYPTSPCLAYCILCRATDFPDWDLFASAIGNEQAYFDPPPGAVSYRPSALAQWEALRGDWTGSCFGFAAGSYLFHDDFLNVGTVFPGHSELGTVPLTADSRKLVNKYYLYQFGFYQQQLINSALKTVTPSQTLAICKEMFSQVTRDDRVLMMFNQSGIGGHAVAPYRCLQDGSNPNLWYLYAHDSNFPADTSKRVAINLGSNTWSYTGQPGWGGSFGLFLLDSVSNYTAPLVMTDTAEATEHIRFYFGEADSVFVESATDTAGFGSEGNFGQIDNGFPITPADGQTRPPIGFFLPTGEYYLSATGVVDGVFTIVDGEKRIFRNGGAKSGIISCYIKANAIAPSITSYGSAGKSGRDIYDSSFIEIISITPDSEIVVNISGLGIGGGDSISVTLTQEQDVQIDNFGEQTSYDLSIQIVTPTMESEFYSENIPIASSTSHLITPDWRPSGDSVVISVDTSMSNSFDSTIVIPNVESPQFVCGDADGNSIVTISDAVYLINYIFAGGPAPAPLVGGDADCNSIVTISDAVYLINYIFAGGAPPCSACP